MARVVSLRSLPLFLLLFSCSKSAPLKLMERHGPQPGQLTRAAALGNLPEVKELLAEGADVNENIGTAEAPVTPLLAAIAEGNPQIAEHLVKEGANPLMKYRGYNAINFAEFQNQTSLVNVLKGQKQ